MALPAARARPDVELTPREHAVLEQLIQSSDPRAPQLVTMLTTKILAASDAAVRGAIVARFEQALADQADILTPLKDMCFNIVNDAVYRQAWRSASHALPGVTGVAGAAQVARALYQGDWHAISTALPSLLPLLPALRSCEAVETVIRGLPPALTEALQSLHDWVRNTDDATTLDLGIEEAGGALAAAVLLWQLHNRLPKASGQLQGVADFIANLPIYWRRLASANGLGGALFAPVPEGPGRLSSIDRKEMVAFKRAEDRRHLQDDNTPVPTPRRLVTPASPPPRRPRFDLQSASAPNRLATPGPIAVPPLDELYPARSPASGVAGGVTGWLSWLGTGVGIVGGFQKVAQNEIWIEMAETGASSTAASAADPAGSALLDGAPRAATTSLLAGVGDVIRRNPVKATATGTFAILAGAAAWFRDAWWPTGAKPPTPEQLAALLTQEVVSLDGAWGTGLDQLLGPLDGSGHSRRRRSVSGHTNSTDASPKTGSVQGLTDVQRDLLLGNAALTGTLRSMQAWALALAQDIAQQDGWQWVAGLVGSEQELVVTQLHVLHHLEPALQSLAALPQQTLDEALARHGFKAGHDGLQVDLGRAKVAGVTVDEKMPLLEYCLLRAGSTPSPIRIIHNGTPLSAGPQELLQGFLASQDCQTLQQEVETRSEVLQPALVKALRARLVIDAVRAKSRGTLGSGPHALRRGADIVLGFLQGAAHVESALLTYRDVLSDGRTVEFSVPHYLVLRSTSADADLHGQVVLYRADLQQFHAFDNENAFRQFLDERRAKGGVHVVDGGIDRTLVDDIIAAAPPALRPRVQEQVQRWQERQAAFQSGKLGTDTWNAGDSFVFEFKPATEPGHTLDDWASQRIRFAQQYAEQQITANRLHWTTLGIANVATDADHTEHLRNDVQTLQDHARPGLTTELVNVLRLAGIDFQDLDPDHILLTVQGTRMHLTDWAVSGWQKHGLLRPILPSNLPDLPDWEGGLPNQRQSLEPWPSPIDLFDMDLTVQKDDGRGMKVTDRQRTAQLMDEAARRAICGVLDDMAQSNRLADSYVAHLKAVASDASNGLHASMANHIRVHTLWMIENAYLHGRLDTADYTALKHAHGRMDGSRKYRSALQIVQIRGHDIHGLWSLDANGKHYVFVPGTSAGDQLLDEAAFGNWLLLPEAQDYVMSRAPLRHHEDLTRAFHGKRTRKGIPVTFGRTSGPLQAAKAFIDMRTSDVDEMTTSQLERVTQALTLFGSVLSGLTCTLGSGGTLAALCVSSTLALVAEGIHSGMNALERGDVDGAVGAVGGSLGDALDVLGVFSLPSTLFQLSRRGLSSVTEAVDALAQWRRQAEAFTPDGQVNPVFSLSSESLSIAGLPVLRKEVGGTTLFAQGEATYVKQGDRYLPIYEDESDNVLRLKLDNAVDETGPPVHLENGQWQRLDRQPNSLKTSTPRTVDKPEWLRKMPEAAHLPADKLDEVEAMFGARAPGMTPSPDMKDFIRDLNMQERIKAIRDDPQSLGQPGDEAIMMRAWADSPLLGNGRSVETFIQEIGEWTRGVRFGKGAVGMMVEVSSPRQLPTLEMLIDAADEVALRHRLKLSPDSDGLALINAVREELARTILLNQEQSLLSWKRWLIVQHRLPTAADNLNKHYPELTKSEAESLTASDMKLEKLALSWLFPTETSAKVAEVLARRSRREQRQSVLSGRLRSMSQVQELRNHLQETVPKLNWKITDDPNGEGFVLSFSDADGKENLRSVTFATDGNVRRATEDGGAAPPSWEQAIFEALTPREQQALGDAAALRRVVVEHMKQTPLVRNTCTLPKAVRRIVKRSADCDPAISVDLTRNEVDARDEVTQALQVSHDHAEQEYARIRALREELTQLRLDSKQPAGITPAQKARMVELSEMTLMHEKNFRMKNFVAYRVGSLMVGGKRVPPSESFPETGSAYSGPPVSWLTPGEYVGNVPMRRVFLRDDEVEKQYKGKGKQRVAIAIPPSDRFRSDYPMGADLMTVSSERTRATGMVELTEQDLGAELPRDGSGGSTHWVTFQAMDDAQFASLQKGQLSPAMRSVLGDTEPLASNLRSLRPGPYRVFEIRSCSEGKFLQLLSDGLIDTDPGTAPRLLAPVNVPVPEVTGEVTLVSDMHPCETTCNRRLTALMKVLPNLNVRVYYHYIDNAERTQHRFQIMVNRWVTRTESEWASNGTDMEQARAQVHALLSDKANPGPRERAERDLMDHPPTASEMPVPRLWTPEEDLIEGF
ncbi:hypothetical protein [Stenotrophomonas sp. 278]|uniref:hypothetical protein n=1 Tax=Stenotrophomonas sp. 278 TaxID=2479851 RepID=UPI000F686650|nr:hypothetical protein [Stenotrophomonas sp. 278]RRU20480.1 hypothetical protein EGJ34_04870 [Stenotrophomonas sp. 278]